MTATATVAKSAAGTRFLGARELLGLTQTELGFRLGVHYTTVARWETSEAGPSLMAQWAMVGLLLASDLKPAAARRFADRIGQRLVVEN